MPNWTAAQKAAIEERGRNILVAAAAGSGKTAVLVERIIRLVTGKEEDSAKGECDVDQLLVMTFTDAAAREMQSRVEAALEQALAQAKKGERRAWIERQLLLLSGASISTMHRFCLNVLRRHFEEIDLDPEFRIGSEQELALMRRDVMEELFEHEYEEGRAEFLHLVDDYGSDQGDETLYALVGELYQFSLAQPFPDQWLRKQLEPFALAPEARLSDTPWYRVILREIELTLRAAEEEIAQLEERAEKAGADAYLETFAEDSAQVRSVLRLLAQDDWTALTEAFATLSFGRLKAVRDVDEQAKKGIQDTRKAIKTRLDKIKEKYFHSSEEEMLADLRVAAPDVRELVHLTLAFHAAFQQAKQEKRLVDFSDLEHFTLEILVDHEKTQEEGTLVPSQTALALQEKYHEVMVDEYQDTNGVQEALVSLVTRDDPPNLFVVGDVKQSIYRFRLADPSLFKEKYETYPKQPETSVRIDLSQNFRSRPEVLSAINTIFSQVMVPETMELSYDESAALHEGAVYPPCQGQTLSGPQELAILYSEQGEKGGKDDEEEPEEERTSIEREAQYIAQRIQKFFVEGTMVYDGKIGDYRPLAYRDIVILLRGIRGRAEPMLKVLQENGIPAYASSDAGYFEAQEIRLMLSLLAILDNAQQDIPLAAVLLSPIGGFSLTEMATVRLAAPEADIFGALLTAADPEKKIAPAVQQKAEQFLARLSHWRDLAREQSVPELIWQLYRETGYYDYVGGLPGGLLKQANLRMLVTRAEEYEQTNFRGLFRFLRFIDRMKAMDSDLAAARTLGESEDVVRVMTIHGSKGLEFPVVFVANLAGAFNLQDTRAELLIHRELGLGPYAVDRVQAVRYATVARHAVAAKMRQEQKAEELRLLYVALTRARERLILVGSVKNEQTLGKLVQRLGHIVGRSELALPDFVPLQASSYLEWLLMALLSDEAGAELRSRYGLAAESTHQKEEKASSAWQVHLVSREVLSAPRAREQREDEILAAVAARQPLPPSAQRKAVEAMLEWSYDERGLSSVPAKVSVSELKRRFELAEEASTGGTPLLQPEEHLPWRRPRFLQKKGRSITGAEYGSLMHSVMQYTDLYGDLTPQGIERQLQEMVLRELIPEEQLRAVRPEAIARFFQSELGRRLRMAKRVWRELPFTRLLPAEKFYAGAQDEQILMQGVIDLLFEENDGRWILVDYKTDKDTTLDRLKKRYGLQMELYREAVHGILQKEVAESYLYLLHDGLTLSL